MSAEIVRIFEVTTALIEIVGVSVLVLGFLINVGRFLRRCRRRDISDPVQEFKRGLGRTVVIGLEVLVAATIVKTATKEATLVSIGLLAGMIMVRTILSWTMMLEMEGRWPWQSPPPAREAGLKGARV